MAAKKHPTIFGQHNAFFKKAPIHPAVTVLIGTPTCTSRLQLLTILTTLFSSYGNRVEKMWKYNSEVLNSRYSNAIKTHGVN